MTLSELRQRLFIDVPTAARLVFDCDERTVRRGIERGQLPAVKVGHKTLLPVPKLLAMLGAEYQAEDHETSCDASDADQGGSRGSVGVLPLRCGGDAA